MCDMGAERMMGIIIVLNKFSISVPYGDTLSDSYQCKVVLEYTKFGCW
jgi:hypothetical protein